MCFVLPSLGSLWCGVVGLAHAAIGRKGRGTGTNNTRRVGRVVAVSNLWEFELREGKERERGEGERRGEKEREREREREREVMCLIQAIGERPRYMYTEIYFLFGCTD